MGKLRTGLAALLTMLVPAVLAVPALGATGNGVVLDVQKTAYTSARGSGGAVKVNVICPASRQATVSVFVTQPPGSENFHFAPSTSFKCNGTVQTVPVGISANFTEPIHTGAATVTPRLHLCNASDCPMTVGEDQAVSFTDTALSRPSARYGPFTRGSDSMILKIGAEGTFSADGSSVSVPLGYRCTGLLDDLEVTVRQRERNSAFLTESLTWRYGAVCDNSWHTFDAVLTYGASNFHSGRAFVKVVATDSDSISAPVVSPFRGVSLTAAS